MCFLRRSDTAVVVQQKENSSYMKLLATRSGDYLLCETLLFHFQVSEVPPGSITVEELHRTTSQKNDTRFSV